MMTQLGVEPMFSVCKTLILVIHQAPLTSANYNVFCISEVAVLKVLLVQERRKPLKIWAKLWACMLSSLTALKVWTTRAWAECTAAWLR